MSFQTCILMPSLLGGLILMQQSVLYARPLEEELLKAARTVLKYSEEKGYGNIGVLKFRIQKGTDKPTDSAGPINLNLPTRLELGLIMADNVRSPIGIIHNASEVASQINGATHLNEEGRRLFFSQKYPLAWGNNKVVPDAFVTGVVVVTDDLSKMTIAMAMFDKTGSKLEPIVQFDAKTTPVELTDIGESFSTRGLFDRRELQFTDTDVTQKAQVAVVKQAIQVRLASASFPLTEPGCPVSLDIAYDGKVVPIEVRGGRAFVREPQSNQVVTLTLRRNSNDQQRYAAVLKVNGESTLGRERQQDLYCRKWVLDPGSRPLVINGYQTGPAQVQIFRVLSKQKSQDRAIDYGADVGTIALVVFRERGSQESTPAESLLTDDAEDFNILQHGTFPSEKVDSLDVLKQRLLAIQKRGLIVEGETINESTRKVTFDANPLPIFSATVTYYRPE